MDIQNFREHILTAPFERGGETVNLKIDINTFSPEYFRTVGSRLRTRQEQLTKELLEKEAQANGQRNGFRKPPKPRGKAAKEAAEKANKPPTEMETVLETFERSARNLEVERAVYVEFLYPEILKDWDLTDKKKPVELTKEVLLGFPPRLVRELWEFCAEQASGTVKKVETTPNPTTTENTSGGSTVAVPEEPTT